MPFKIEKVVDDGSIRIQDIDQCGDFYIVVSSDVSYYDKGDLLFINKRGDCVDNLTAKSWIPLESCFGKNLIVKLADVTLSVK